MVMPIRRIRAVAAAGLTLGAGSLPAVAPAANADSSSCNMAASQSDYGT